MDMPVDRIEFETMLLGRHMSLLTSRGGGRLDRSAYILLSRIRAEGPMSIGQLRDAFGLDTSTLNRQTAAMLRVGVVERIPDPDGGIARKFAITAEGEHRLDKDRAENRDGLQRVLAEWTPEEAAQLADSLARLNRDIERLDGRPWPRD
ncbi:MarR family transcriptional regulator [Streptomyces poriferorum]|uniref:MarR family transcriptional regulator n=1 Tax=Streptomyces poriferorum TaxID=2798799 RepID=A0ABY9IMN6_9ACTN|nr:MULTISPECIES: MarR family transcriptional regulator [Streptomyces]WSQ42982.1 MarR family transcriptional regulator [Streptomyces sp. NBC_01220]MBW5247577.1 MarR family transcriptional regulator [Streptomyces poriferorum]MBW5257499.1 MarR family transcriptional regulator [Streptomyces poriferorum]MDP5317251.1 MarR family transcriptional regulator [Streptomyces sp. Alt4]WLQ51734.1 MarR family transcriptional regulator [Streptomyces sp. Alt1]